MGLKKYRADIQGKTQGNGAIPFFSKWMGGPSLALIRNCPIKGIDITPRTVYVSGEADTFFSIPGACSHKKKIIRGYITTDDNREYYFQAYKDQGHP